MKKRIFGISVHTGTIKKNVTWSSNVIELVLLNFQFRALPNSS